MPDAGIPRPDAPEQPETYPEEAVSLNTTQLYWGLQIAGWAGYTLFRLVPSALLTPLQAETLLSFLLSSVVGLVVTHSFREVVHQLRWKQMTLGQLAPRVLGAALLMGVVSHFALLFLQRDLLRLASFRDTSNEWALAIQGISDGFFIYLIWSLLYFTITYFYNYQRAAVNQWKLQAQVEAAKLEALKLQLNPHFLFNSLNSVRALIAERPVRAQHMVTRLARLLRTTLQAENVTVPLERELKTVRTYLELESVRFEERLCYHIEVPDALLHHTVPFLLLQTLVENAIKHGIAQQPNGGTIAVSAQTSDTHLRLRVTNPGQVASDAPGRGVGLQNARERLRLLFGERATLSLQNKDANTVEAEVRLPLEESERLRTSPADLPSDLPSSTAG